MPIDSHRFSSRPGNVYSFSVVKIVLIINILVFAIVPILHLFKFPIGNILILTPKYFIHRYMIWTIVTHMFVHGGMWEIIWNVYMIWALGSQIEEVLGSKKFLTYYLFTGFGAGLFCLLIGWGQMVAIFGAYGIIFGLITAHAMLFPESVIHLFFIIPLKMKHAVWIIGLFNLMMALATGSYVYLGFLGGCIITYLYFKNEWVRNKLSLIDPWALKVWYGERKRKNEVKKRVLLEQEADNILDKISKHGIHSLTKKEKEIMDKRSRRNSD